MNREQEITTKGQSSQNRSGREKGEREIFCGDLGGGNWPGDLFVEAGVLDAGGGRGFAGWQIDGNLEAEGL